LAKNTHQTLEGYPIEERSLHQKSITDRNVHDRILFWLSSSQDIFWN